MSARWISYSYSLRSNLDCPLCALESEWFAEQTLSIQNGTHPALASNPVLTALDDLSSELDDLILGFRTRLRRIKRTASRAFNSAGHDGVTMDDDDSGPPDITILPVPDDERESVIEQGVPPVLLGRDDMEIQEAMRRLETHEAGTGTSADVLNESAPGAKTDPMAPKEARHVEL